MDPGRMPVIDGGGFDNGGVIPQIPATVLEHFIPGYSVIAEFLLEWTGIDVGILVSIGLLVFVGSKATSAIYRVLESAFSYNLKSYVLLESDDDMFDDLMKWFSQIRAAEKARTLKIAKAWWTPRSRWSGYFSNDDQDPSAMTAKIFNYRIFEAEEPLHFVVNQGTYWFWHRGRLFFLSWWEKEKAELDWSQKKQLMLISCVGRSAQPIKNLLEEIRLSALAEGDSRTKIKRPSPPDGAHKVSPGTWQRVAVRPSRHLSTVTLDHQQKTSILQDINEFIHPSKARWYSARGIPYRRGYLFSGPPGTGKSSLCFALAGVFGLDLHVISLQDSTLTEEVLTQLFNGLPERCIVLLEDIDSAGLRREEDYDPDDSTSIAVNPFNRDKKGKVSLAGLLNAIDGVASHEGHILIMTTNHPEKLDEALTRPGRVDLHIKFNLATKFQAREIFMRMFIHEKKRKPRTISTSLSDDSSKSLTPTLADYCEEKLKKEDDDRRYCPFLSLAELEELGDRFAARIPDRQISPAHIQGFLLIRKLNPRKALDDVADWVKEMLASRDDFPGGEAFNFANLSDRGESTDASVASHEAKRGSGDSSTGFEDLAAFEKSQETS